MRRWKVQGALRVYVVLRVIVQRLNGVCATYGRGLRAEFLPLHRFAEVIQYALFRLLTDFGAPQLLYHGTAGPRGHLPGVLHERVLLGGVAGGSDGRLMVRGRRL